MTEVLTAQQVDTLHAMAEWFMPAVEGYPSNDDADPDGSVLLLALDQLRPLLPAIAAALDCAAREGVTSYLQRIDATEADTYELLRTLLIGRYLMCRPVWDVLGYTGRRPSPIQLAEYENEFTDGILEPVLARGKIFRPTPN